MSSRPLLDYLTDQDNDRDRDRDQPAFAVNEPVKAPPRHQTEPHRPAHAAEPEASLAERIGAILHRQHAATQAHHEPPAPHVQPHQVDWLRIPANRQEPRAARLVVEPPPMVSEQPGHADDFAKFAEAVRLIGEAARRFVEPEPKPAPVIAAQPQQAVQTAATAQADADIAALTGALREVIDAFRHVADDLAVSAGEIRRHATRPFEEPPRERLPNSYRARRHDDDIDDLREAVEAMQDRLDAMSHGRRRARY